MYESNDISPKSQNTVAFVKSLNFSFYSMLYKGRLLRKPALCKAFTKKNQLNELILQICRLDDY